MKKKGAVIPGSRLVTLLSLVCIAENPTCLKVAQNGAIYKRKDGIVIIDPQKAVGQKNLISSCPYRAIYWNEEKQVAQKCTMCAHLLDKGWKEPRCVEVCPTGALIFGDLDDPDSEIARLLASGKTEILHPEYRMGEKVSYIGLPRRFVAGAVVFGDKDECAEGVKVTLEGEGEKQTIATDIYGDFEFEGLASDKEYVLKVEAPGYKGQKIIAKTAIDVYLGDIILEKAAIRKIKTK